MLLQVATLDRFEPADHILAARRPVPHYRHQVHVLVDGLRDTVEVVPHLGIGVVTGAGSLHITRIERVKESVGHVGKSHGRQSRLTAMTTHWNRALVTGASSGIGRAFATQLAAAGTDLVVVARDTERLEALADEFTVDVEVLTADLGDPAAVSTVADRLRAVEDPVDLLVNNAGIGFAKPTLDTPDAADERTVAVNVVALHRLTRAAGHAMVERGGGTILNVSSIAGDMPGPQSGTYNATKAFVTSLSEALHSQLKDQKVTVTALCPGLTRTEFHDRAGIPDMHAPAIVWQTADEVAKAGLAGAAAGKAVVIPGLLNKSASRLLRSLPRSVTRAVVGAARS